MLHSQLSSEQLHKQAQETENELNALRNRYKETTELLCREFLSRFQLDRYLAERETPCVSYVLPDPGVGSSWINPSTWDDDTFRLHFCCEIPGKWHFLDHPGFRVPNPTRFLRSCTQYIQELVRYVSSLLS